MGLFNLSYGSGSQLDYMLQSPGEALTNTDVWSCPQRFLLNKFGCSLDIKMLKSSKVILLCNQS